MKPWILAAGIALSALGCAGQAPCTTTCFQALDGGACVVHPPCPCANACPCSNDVMCLPGFILVSDAGSGCSHALIPCQ
jgi:hypothetical protein